MVFVLLERDPAAAATIRFWAAERVRLGLNHEGDPKICEAERTADEMESRGSPVDGWYWYTVTNTKSSPRLMWVFGGTAHFMGEVSQPTHSQYFRDYIRVLGPVEPYKPAGGQ